jgi:hypothetical protein
MMISDPEFGSLLPRPRRTSPAGGLSGSAPAPRGLVFAIAALPGEAEGFRWPSWLSPFPGLTTARQVPSSSKRSR